MEYFANAVAAILSDNGKILFLSILLNRMANIAQESPRFDELDAAQHALFGDLANTLGNDGRFADIKHAASVTVVTVFDDGDVDINDVAFFEAFIAGDAVADDVV